MIDNVLGIDVSKRKFDVALRRGDGKSRSRAFPNSEAGFQQLQGWLGRLGVELVRLREQIAEHIDQHPELKRRRDLLCSIPGIGETTAARLLSEMSATEFSRARQLAAYAGLVPSPRESGSSVRGRGRLSKRGNVRLRRALYWPAIVAMRHNPTLRAFAQWLRQAGKPTMVIVAALMRKLLHIAFGVLKHGRPFDPNYHPAAT